jgi:hypothetical protein
MSGNQGFRMKRMAVLVAVAACSLLLSVSRAADSDDPSPSPPKASKAPSDWLHSGSLEIPGVTACHQCEWRPKPHQMGAADRCGIGPDGNPKLAEFECGYSEDCQRVCNFTRCVTP